MTAIVTLCKVSRENGPRVEQLLGRHKRPATAPAVGALQGGEILLVRLNLRGEDVGVTLQSLADLVGVHLFENHNVDASLRSQVD